MGHHHCHGSNDDLLVAAVLLSDRAPAGARGREDPLAWFMILGLIAGPPGWAVLAASLIGWLIFLMARAMLKAVFAALADVMGAADEGVEKAAAYFRRRRIRATFGRP